MDNFIGHAHEVISTSSSGICLATNSRPMGFRYWFPFFVLERQEMVNIGKKKFSIDNLKKLLA